MVHIIEGYVSTIAGGASSSVGGADGSGTSIYIAAPYGVAVDSVGGVYFTDNSGYTVRYLSSSGLETFSK